MKKNSANTITTSLQLSALFILVACISFFLFSFTVKMENDFLKQMGITKPQADEKITNAILSGSIDTYGLRNIKNIAAGNKAGIATDILSYIKRQVNTAAFIKQYEEMREAKKSKLIATISPEQMHNERVADYEKSLASMEATVKSANASMKPTYEKMLVDSRKLVAEAKDPNNKVMTNYRKRYPQAVKEAEVMNQDNIAQWEARYPSNHLSFIKLRLQEFMYETKDIDFNATLVTKKGKKVFVNPTYEGKSSRWKMAFRAGKEAVETSRTFVQEWIEEIK